MPTKLPDVGAIRQSLDARYLTHAQAVARFLALLPRLEGAAEVPRVQAEEALAALIEAGRALRGLLTDAWRHLESASLPTLHNREALEVVVEQTCARLDALVRQLPARRLQDLGDELRRGRCTAGWRTGRLEGLRSAALRQVDVALSDPASVEYFPGPDVMGSSWLIWFWTLEEAAQSSVGHALEAGWGDLFEFVFNIAPEYWTAGEGASPEASDATLRSESTTHPSGDASAITADEAPTSVADARPPVAGDVLDLGRVETDDIFSSDETATPEEVEDEEPGGSDAWGPTARGEPNGVEGTRRAVDGELSSRVEAPTPVLEMDDPASDGSLVPAAAGSLAAPHPPSDPQPDRDAETSPAPASALRDGDAQGDVEPLESPTPSTEAAEGPITRMLAPIIDHRVDDLLEPVAVPPGRETYLSTWWLDATGRSERAPWLSGAFAGQVYDFQAVAIWLRRWADAWLAARAAEAQSLPGAATVALLEWARAFARGLAGEGRELVGEVNGRLKLALDEVRALRDHPVDWLSAVLSVLDDPECPFSASDLSAMLDLSPNLTRLLEEWLNNQRGGGAAAVLRAQLDADPPSVEALEEQLAAARRTLHSELTRLYMAAGGTVQRTHCREAWDSFMEEAHPVIQRIAGGDVRPTDVSTLRGLGRRAPKVFDKWGAKYQDRRHMDKAVDALLGCARRVLETSATLDEVRGRSRAHRAAIGFSDDVVKMVRAIDSTAASSLESWIVGLVRSHVSNDDSGSDPVYPPDEVRVRPLLVEGWSEFSIDELELDVRRADKPVRALARRLDAALDEPIPEFETWLARHRPDLLVDDGSLSPATIHVLEQHRQRADAEQNALVSRLRRVWLELNELADPAQERAREAIDLIYDVGERVIVASDLAWLTLCAERLERRIEQVRGNLVAQARREGVDERFLETSVASGHIDEVVRSLGPERVKVGARRLRETRFRRDARKTWPRPEAALSSLANEMDSQGGSPERTVSLLTSWIDCRDRLRQGPLAPEHAGSLREAFAEFLFRLTQKQRKSKVDRRTPRARTDFHQVDIQDLRVWLAEDVPNPNFLPQFARLKTFALKVAPIGVGESSLPRRIYGEGATNEVTVILAPGLKPPQRTAVRDYLAQHPHSAPIAVIDDLDLCRILNIGADPPDPLLAVLEVIAEQQPWSAFGPYEVVEGQHMRMEMFVGRQQEAARLARQASYSRIFSGRRLGKTALLRAVEGNPDLRALPSGNTLRVVFCAIAGMETEEEVARAIIGALADQIGRTAIDELDGEPRADEAGSGVARLKWLLPRLIDARPSESFLILLDEADTFFQAQVQSSDSASQRSLSWWMSRHAEKALDAADLPRIRFIFCGYLYTEQNRGVWENKGDVLYLLPLNPEDAVQLVAAPLARIGIDAVDQADNIAFRCGYQPAVIIRFGLTLIERLDRTRARQERDTVEVAAEDVIEVFHSNPVQSAIREACWLNFVGHPVGQLVFGALLMELRTHAPAAPVEDISDPILERIREVSPEFDPAELYEGKWSDLVAQQLRELTRRSLLSKAGHHPEAHRLRFPHHLPVLMHPEPSHYVRDALSRIQAGRRFDGEPWLIEAPVLDNLGVALGVEGRDLDIKAAVVITQWAAPLVDPDAGLAPRLGLDVTSERVAYGEAALQRVDRLRDDSEPPLLIGGPPLARRLAESDFDEIDFEWARTGRLTRRQVLSWFKRRRAAEFTALEAPDRIHRATGGIPLLIGRLDEHIQNHGTAPTLNEEQLTLLLDALRDDFDSLRARLLDPNDLEALTEREVELIHMVARGSQYGELVHEAILEDTIEFGPRRYQPQDGPALRMLLAVGLIPRRAVRGPDPLSEIAPLAPDDPIRRLFDLPD